MWAIFLGDFVVSSSQSLLQLDDISNVTLCVFIMTPCVFISLLSHMQRSTETFTSGSSTATSQT